MIISKPILRSLSALCDNTFKENYLNNPELTPVIKCCFLAPLPTGLQSILKHLV